MNGLWTAAEEVQQLCEAAGWSFCFIGGLAVQRWGEARVTRDVDLTLLTGFGEEDRFVDRLLGTFSSRAPDAHSLARRARVILLQTDAGVPVDVALGALPFEDRSIARSTDWHVPGATPLRTCTAEDLVVHKVFAGRDRDWSDVRGVIARQGPRLDVDLILAEVTPLLEIKGALENLARFHEMVTERR